MSNNEDPTSKFTPSAQQVLGLARREAKELGQNLVDSKHVLLGLLKQGRGPAAVTLQKLGITYARVRKQITLAGENPEADTLLDGDLPWAAEARQVFEAAYKEARMLSFDYVGTDHLLLGILKNPTCQAVKILKALEIDTDNIRAELIKALCGIDTNLGNGLTFSKTLQSPGNATIVYSGAKGIEERDLQKIVFERCQAVADGGTIYKLESNAEQGIHKGEPIASFDDFKGVNWVYEYKGVLVNCSPSKYGGSKSVDRFELRFGR